MTKYKRLKNSQMMFGVVCVALFIAIALLLCMEIPTLSVAFLKLTPVTEIILYLSFLGSYLALNDEKSAYRPERDMKSQNKIKGLKVFLIIIFLSSFIKNSFINVLVSNGENLISNFIGSVINVVLSMPFFIMIISLHLFLKYGFCKEIKVITLISIVVSAFYALFKGLSYFYDYRGETSDLFIFSAVFQYAVCLIQYASNLFMFKGMKKYFSNKEEEFREIYKAEKKERKYPLLRENITEKNGFMLDSADDFLKSETE